MKTTTDYVKVVTYQSDVFPSAKTNLHAEAEIIAWADANPILWKIVSESRSKVFGKNAITYMDCERGDGLELARLFVLRRELAAPVDSIFRWRAAFTHEHYNDKSFASGFFQQHDGKYDRGCLELDYTKATLDEVIKRFVVWSEQVHRPTKTVKLDGVVVRTFA
jgi:hypothetical protein